MVTSLTLLTVRGLLLGITTLFSVTQPLQKYSYLKGGESFVTFSAGALSIFFDNVSMFF